MGAYNDMVDKGHNPKTQINKTATTTATGYIERSGGIPLAISSFIVTNRSSSINLLISTDGGTSFFVVTPLDTQERRLASVSELQIKSASSTVSYDLFYTIQP